MGRFENELQVNSPSQSDPVWAHRNILGQSFQSGGLAPVRWRSHKVDCLDRTEGWMHLKKKQREDLKYTVTLCGSQGAYS